MEIGSLSVRRGVLAHFVFCAALLLAALLPVRPAGAADITGPYDRQVQQMHVAYCGRPGDPLGVEYWAGRLEAVGGNWIADLVNALGTSAD